MEQQSRHRRQIALDLNQCIQELNQEEEQKIPTQTQCKPQENPKKIETKK